MIKFWPLCLNVLLCSGMLLFFSHFHDSVSLISTLVCSSIHGPFMFLCLLKIAIIWIDAADMTGCSCFLIGLSLGGVAYLGLVDQLVSWFPWEKEHTAVPLALQHFSSSFQTSIASSLRLGEALHNLEMWNQWRTENQPTFDQGSSSSSQLHSSVGIN